MRGAASSVGRRARPGGCPYPAPVDSAGFLRIVLDPLRLGILGRATEGPVDVDAVARAHGVAPKTVLIAVGKLRAAGLLDDESRLVPERLRVFAAELSRPSPASADITDEAWNADEEKVLRAFFSGSRLLSIPAARGKKRIILEHLAQEFEVGTRYSEREVNEVLLRFHDDYAALRRYMIEEDLMSRADGEYWRSGGRVEG